MNAEISKLQAAVNTSTTTQAALNAEISKLQAAGTRCTTTQAASNAEILRLNDDISTLTSATSTCAATAANSVSIDTLDKIYTNVEATTDRDTCEQHITTLESEAASIFTALTKFPLKKILMDLCATKPGFTL